VIALGKRVALEVSSRRPSRRLDVVLAGATFYVSMAVAALIIELVFHAVALVPPQRVARVVETSISFNYTTVLNLIFLAVAAVIVYRFFRTGGVKMLRMMDIESAPLNTMAHAHAGQSHDH
jgi:uncharacterized membrane protein YraQ (UPF0718 family)